MKNVLLILVLWISIKGYSQEISDYKKEAKKAVIVFFEGFHQGDTTKMKTVLGQDTVLQTIGNTKDGKRTVQKGSIDALLEAIHKRPADQKWEERLLSFTIEASKGIAHVWTPYEFYVNNEFSHCGVNTFQLFNDGSSWRIISIADTRNKEGCN